MAENVKKGKKGNASKAKVPKGRKKSAGKSAAEDLPVTPEVCPKSVLTRLMRQSYATDEAIASERGAFGQQVAEATARSNLHVWAFRQARRLQKMGDLKRAEAWHQLKAYVEALDLVQEDLFRNAPRSERPLPDFDEERRAEPLPGEVGPMLPEGATNGGNAANA